MAAIVGPFQIRRLVKAMTRGVQATRSGWVPGRAGHRSIEATGKGKKYGPYLAMILADKAWLQNAQRRRCPNILILPSCIALKADMAARNTTPILCHVRSLDRKRQLRSATADEREPDAQIVVGVAFPKQ